MPSATVSSLIDNVISYALRNRIVSTRLVASVLVILILITDHIWGELGFLAVFFQTAGLALVATGTLGRLWASMYVSGYKARRLITEGPYSVVRNPLYLFSFLGATGVGFAAESLLITAVIVAAFLLYYPLVVNEEEERLSGLYGEEFAEYVRRTPRFIPNLSLFHEPETYPVNARHYRRAFIDASFFVWSYGLLQLIEKLHKMDILPTLFRIP